MCAEECEEEVCERKGNAECNAERAKNDYFIDEQRQE